MCKKKQQFMGTRAMDEYPIVFLLLTHPAHSPTSSLISFRKVGSSWASSLYIPP